MRRLMLVPLSGYANRLQAVASATILAEQLGARLSICWESDPVVPVSADAVFSAGFCSRFVITPEQAVADFGHSRDSIPRYLTVDHDRILLAGSDRGEQHFMEGLRAAVRTSPSADTIVIAAGGRFFLPDEGEGEDHWDPRFRALRHDFYRGLQLHEDIEEAARRQVTERPPFIGLHVRYTDRAHQAPFDRTVRMAVRTVAEQSGLSDIFVAGDSAAARTKWADAAGRLNLTPWSVPHDAFDRSQAGSERAALVDWRILGQAAGLVYFAESTFAVEAAVASDGWEHSVGLGPHPLRSAAVRMGAYGRSALTYPRRHGWVGAATG